MDWGDRSDGSVVPVHEVPSLILGEPTPNAMLFANGQGVRQTFLLNGAGPTDLLGPLFPRSLLGAPLEAAGGKEDLLARPAARCEVLPKIE